MSTTRRDAADDLEPALRETVPLSEGSSSAEAARRGIGRYPVVGELGQGGMGQVFRVFDATLGREVAAKVILGAVDREQVERFALEAQVTGQLEHPNIVPVHEFGQTESGQLYFTMKAVEGLGLDARLKQLREGRNPLALAARLEIFLKVCDAIAFAHSRGVVHRDLKPANIMVGRFGEVQVMDWGLAKLLRQKAGGDVTLHPSTGAALSGATLDGSIKGTPAYMPPEQADGEVGRIDERSDVYALGAVLYELLTLQPPFAGDVLAVLEQVSAGSLVRPSERAAGVPWELEAVVLKAMAFAPEERYSTVEGLRADIASYLEGRVLSAADYSARQWLAKWLGRHKMAAAVCLAVALVSGLALIALRSQKARQRAQRQAFERARVERLIEGVDQRLVGVPDAEALQAALAGRGGAEEEAQARQHRAPLARLLRAASLLDRALSIAPRDASLRARRLAVGRRLALCATLSGDYTLAAQASADLEFWGATKGAVRAALAQVEQARTAGLRWRQEQLERMLADMAGGLAGRARHFALWGIDDYVFEAVSYREPQTIALLGAALDAFSRRAEGATGMCEWSEGDRDTINFASRVLSRFGQPEALTPLTRLLAAVEDRQLLVTIAVALCNSRRPEAYKPLVALRERLSVNSASWRRITRSFVKVPEPAESSGEAIASEVLYRRMLARFEIGKYAEALADCNELISRSPRAHYHNMRGNCRIRLNQRLRGLADFNVAITKRPQNGVYYSNRAQVMRELGRFDEALADYARALELGYALEVYTLRAKLWIRLGQPKRALEDLAQAEAKQVIRDRAFWHQVRGEALMRLREFVPAIGELNRGIALAPERDELLTLRGRVYLLMGRQGEGAADIERALELAPNAAAALVCRARIRMNAGRHRDAAADLERVLMKQPGHHEALTYRGQLKMRLKKPESALEDFDSAIRNHRVAAAGWIGRASALRELKRFDEALEAADEAIRLDPLNRYGYGERGIINYTQRKPEAAIRDFLRAVEIDPSFLSGHVNLGQLYFGTKRYAEAIAAFDRVLAIQKDVANAYYYRGLSHRRLQQHERALADFNKVIELQPGRAEAYVNRGDLLDSLRRFAEARRDLRKATELVPELWQAWAGLGKAALAQGDKAAAAAAFKTAIAKAPASVQPGLRQLLAQAER